MGVLCIGFFLATDPRLLGARSVRIGWSSLLVDAVYDATPGTVVGLLGAGVVVLIGVWLMTRRAS